MKWWAFRWDWIYPEERRGNEQCGMCSDALRNRNRYTETHLIECKRDTASEQAIRFFGKHSSEVVYAWSV